MPDFVCTWFPDVWFEISITCCCIGHDLVAQTTAAHWDLMVCVIGQLGWLGIPVGGAMFIGLVGPPGMIYRAFKRPSHRPRGGFFMEKAMNFVGTGTRLSSENMINAAAGLGVEVAALKAVVEVEARGVGFDKRRRPVILFEPHVFYRLLGAGPKRDRAVKEGLAYKKWGAKPYPKTQDNRYDQLQRAMAIDKDAALQATSWGLGQVMGFNWKLCGYKSIADFVSSMLMGEAQQLDAMLRYIDATNLVPHIKSKKWASFARGYNGAGYKKNAYDAKLSRAYLRAKGRGTPADPMLDGVLSIGEKGGAITPMQRDLKMLGYKLSIDGDFGPLTLQAVKEFQKQNDLIVDGRAGAKTLAAIEELIDEHARAAAAAAAAAKHAVVTPPAPPGNDPNSVSEPPGKLNAFLTFLAALTGRFFR